MIATIVRADEIVTKTGRLALRLEVLDDYEQRHFMFFSPYAMAYFERLLGVTKTPKISKDGGKTWSISMRHWEGKIISVVSETREFQGRMRTFLHMRWRY